MANAQALLSGSWRVSSTSGLFNQTFSNLTTVSATLAMDFVLLPGVSDFVVSLPQFSNMNVLGLQANNQVRINFGGIGHATSYVSQASAGILTTQLAWTAGGGSGLLNIHFANSGSDSSTVRLIMCTS